MGSTGEVWGGDTYVAAVNIGPQYAESGTNALIELIRSALENAGLSYNTSVVFDTGMLNPWFLIRGNSNVDASSEDDLQNQFVGAINEGLRSAGFQSAQVLNFGWKGIVTHKPSGDPNDPFHTPTGGPGSGLPAPPGSTLQQLQANCAAQGLVYDARSTNPGGCECGFFDSLMVSAGVKNTCGESALGVKSGLAGGLGIAAVLLVGFLIIKNR